MQESKLTEAKEYSNWVHLPWSVNECHNGPQEFHHQSVPVVFCLPVIELLVYSFWVLAALQT